GFSAGTASGENDRDRADVRELASGRARAPSRRNAARTGALAGGFERAAAVAAPRTDVVRRGQSAAAIPGAGASGRGGLRSRTLANPLRRAVAARPRASRSAQGPAR